MPSGIKLKVILPFVDDLHRLNHDDLDLDLTLDSRETLEEEALDLYSLDLRWSLWQSNPPSHSR